MLVHILNICSDDELMAEGDDTFEGGPKNTTLEASKKYQSLLGMHRKFLFGGGNPIHPFEALKLFLFIKFC